MMRRWPFGTAVAEQVSSGSGPLQPWSTVSLPGASSDGALAARARPADLEAYAVDLLGVRREHGHRDAGDRADLGAGQLGRAAAGRTRGRPRRPRPARDES